MAKSDIATFDALERAIDTNQALDALVSLLGSAREADVPSGRALSELFGILQKNFEEQLAAVKEGLRS